MKEYQKPFLGVAWYPEDWNEEQREHDIREMKRAGVSVVRIAEFAWTLMEPRAGEYHFEWLHEAVDRLDRDGIRVIMCTPTATPPTWFSRAYPSAFVTDENGHSAKRGWRRNHCSCNPDYLAACRNITTRLGEEFGHDPRVIGWQIDNELDFQYCHCDHCLAAFRRYLEEKYGTIENLNRRWNLNIFSLRYDSFEDVEFPDHAQHNPHIRLEYLLFQSKVQAGFLTEQIETLRPLVDAPIGTDAKPYNRIDYEAIAAPSDIMQFNHYDKPSDLPQERFWFDLLRPLKPRPFWNTETSTCWIGGTDTFVRGLRPWGFCRINSWFPIALGGEAAMYWLWRTHWAGHEVMHGAVMHADGRPFHIFEEVQQVADEFRRCEAFISSTKVSTACAYHSTSLAWNMMETQSIVNGYHYFPVQLKTSYEPLVNSGIRTDVIGAPHSLEGYRMLVSPFIMSLDEGDLPARIARFVREGGVWVVGPMTDIRDEVGARYTASPYGMLETLTGVRRAYEMPDPEGLIKCAWQDGTPALTRDWYEIFDEDEDALVRITEGYPTLVGKAVALRKQVGKGVVYIVGAPLGEAEMKRIYAMAAEDAGIPRYETEGNLIVAPRSGDGVEGLIVAECRNAPASITLDTPMTDLLTGNVYVGKVDLAPYDLLVLQK